MEILYCNKWWLQKKKPLDILTLSAAKKRHMNGKDYTAVLSDDGIVKYVIEILAGNVFVKFLDENLNMYLLYEFDKKNDDNIFLSLACYYKYENGSDRETEFIVFGFKENGELCMEKRDLINNEVEERESVVDVSCNWDKFPDFGKYEHLLIEERE